MTEPTLPEESLFLQALELESAAEQTAFLDRECGPNTELRASVEALLRHHREGSGFLESPPTEVIAAGEQLTTSESAPSLDFLAPSAAAGSIGRLGHYEVLETLGAGGFGIVLKARDAKLDRIVAIKTLSQSLASSAAARQRFVREAKAAAAVKHENVVGIYHVSDDGPVPYLVMECVSGLSLEEKLQQDGMLDVPAILRIGMQVASGLAAAHKQGLVHRDVKPGNILLENGVERVKITDFGLARAANDAAITRSGDIAGTPQYMSPEQALAQGVDARSDLFSLGSVLYAMCTGRSPFRAETTLAAMRRVCDDTPRSLREVNPAIPDWLVGIIERLLAKKPDDRYQSAAEVADVLSQRLAQLQQPGGASALRSETTVNKQGPALHGRWFVGTAAAVIILACTLALTEAGGLTNLATTVVRIFTPEGTLIVETNEPGVKVTVEGDGGLKIKGTGLEEIRLRPGSYKVRADKDGRPMPLERELVSVATRGREVVKVKLEPAAASTGSGAVAEKGAFVLLGGNAAAERKFDTLAEAVRSAGNGDTIEIRGNGPFAVEPVSVYAPLVIRALAGKRPILTFGNSHPYGLETRASLVLEGLELICTDTEPRAGSPGAFIRVINSAPLYVSHCRLVMLGSDRAVYGSPSHCEVRHCEVIRKTRWGNQAFGGTWLPGQRLNVEGCVITGHFLAVDLHGARPPAPCSARFFQNTFVGRWPIALWRWDVMSSGEIPFSLDLANNLFSSEEHFLVLADGKQVPESEPAAALEFVKQFLSCKGQHNVLEPGIKPLHFNRLEKSVPLVSDFAAWQKLFGLESDYSQTGPLRFEGGVLRERNRVEPQTITAGDFRLRPDSAGYRAGPDGKDLGADVDLVGPGAAYERWKKTPEYQEWLKVTGQSKE